MPVTNPSTTEPGTDSVPMMLHNGTVHSTAEPYAEAMLVENGQVAWLGSDETAQRLADARMLHHDLDRGLVTPAFVGSAVVSLDQLDADTLTELLDAAARDLGCSALRLRIPVAVQKLIGDTHSDLSEGLGRALRATAQHPVTVYPVVELTGLHADGGAPSIAPVNTMLDLLGELDLAAENTIALQLRVAEVMPNLLGVRSWCTEAGRQLLLECSGADAATVVDAVVTSHQHLRELKQTPSPVTPTVLVGFDSAASEHWEALLNTAGHVLLTRPGHLATALRAGVPTAAAPGEHQNPWQLVSDHVYHTDDPVSVRAGFNAQTRGAYRSLVGASPESAQLNPGSTATYTVWEVDQLAVQTPNSTAAAWSTDTRARTPLLPFLDGVQVPRLVTTVIAGQTL